MEDRASLKFKNEWEEELGPKAASRLTSLATIVKDYSTIDAETREEIQDHIEVLRRAAYEATKWSYLGAGNPAAQKKLMRHELVESNLEQHHHRLADGLAHDHIRVSRQSKESLLRRTC